MDFRNRGVSQPSEPQYSEAPQENKTKKAYPQGKLMKIFHMGLLVCGTILIVALLLSIATSKNNAGEADYVDTTKYQAVFLNGGQVYFGKIVDLTNNYVALGDIYYLQVNQKVQPGDKNAQNNFTLAKLGCELHRPQDAMLINRDQVIFWENLKDDDGTNTVPGAIKAYAKSTGGKAQECAKADSSSSEGSGSSSTDSNKPATTPASDNASDNATPNQ